MITHPNLLADYGDGSSLVEQYFCLTELVDGLFRCKPFPGYVFPPFYEIITGVVLGGQDTITSVVPRGESKESFLIMLGFPLAPYRAKMHSDK